MSVESKPCPLSIGMTEQDDNHSIRVIKLALFAEERRAAQDGASVADQESLI